MEDNKRTTYATRFGGVHVDDTGMYDQSGEPIPMGTLLQIMESEAQKSVALEKELRADPSKKDAILPRLQYTKKTVDNMKEAIFDHLRRKKQAGGG